MLNCSWGIVGGGEDKDRLRGLKTSSPRSQQNNLNDSDK